MPEESVLEKMYGDVEVVVPRDETLSLVQSLVQKQLDLEDRIKALDAELEQSKKDLASVQEFELPAALQNHGMTDITMSDGSKISIRQEYYAGIKEEKKAEAFGWLESNNYSDLIKHSIVTEFTRGQAKEAFAVMELLKENNVEFNDKRQVHPQTLKAFVREQIEAGKPLPLETFGVHIKQICRINRNK